MRGKAAALDKIAEETKARELPAFGADVHVTGHSELSEAMKAFNTRFAGTTKGLTSKLLTTGAGLRVTADTFQKVEQAGAATLAARGAEVAR
jgi:hypothetical protein